MVQQVPRPSPVLGAAREALADIAVSYEIIEEESRDVPVLIDNIEPAPVSTSPEESALASGSAEETALLISVHAEKSAPLASAPKSALLGCGLSANPCRH